MNFFRNNLDKTLEKLLKNFLSKIKYGSLEVEFPSGEKFIFSGENIDLNASIKIHNYNFLSYILKKGFSVIKCLDTNFFSYYSSW